MWTIYLLAVVLILSLLYLKKGSKYAELRKHFWGPPSLPFIGAAHNFITGNDTDILPLVEKWMIDHESGFFVNILGNMYLAVHDLNVIEFLLGSNKLIDKSNEYKFFHDWFGLGLLTSTGLKWRSHRKILTPSFHYKILEEFVQVFDKQSNTLITKLRKYAGTEAIDVFKPISLCTLDIICETAMGTQVNAQEDPDSPFVRSVRELCGIIYSRMFTPLHFDWIYAFSKTRQKEIAVVKVMRTFSENIINARKQAIAKESESGYKEEDEVGLKKKYTFLDCLLRSRIDGEPISDSDIREEVDTFMFEGHDTTSIAISFTLYCLSKNPDIQEKAYQEIQAVYKEDKNTESTIELNELRYLEQVIKESLRLYPPVSIFARLVEEDVTYDGILFPKGLTVAVLPYISHRNAKVFPEPHKFDPERFTLDNQAKRHPYAYIPFSAGPRNCIGQKFAMLELKCTIAKILRHYEILEASPDYEVKPLIRVTLESENGIMVKLKERK